jgi:peptidoglycan/xylan/chitin deacetylase (PgdA/CDA1 family)
VLAYHNVVPDQEPEFGERSLHLPLARFREHLDLLEEGTDILPLDRILEPVPPAARPRVAITFDDAYRGAVAQALPLLRRRQLPATLFVAPGLLGGSVPWWDHLAQHHGGTMPDGIREQALAALGGDQEKILGAVEAPSNGPPAPSLRRIATEEEIRDGLWEGLTLGAHSWSHPNLTRVLPDHLAVELEVPLRWLRERFPGHARPWLAYPYGLADIGLESAVAAAGYESAWRVSGGALPSGPRMLDLPRLNVPAGLGVDGLVLRLSGLVTR